MEKLIITKIIKGNEYSTYEFYDTFFKCPSCIETYIIDIFKYCPMCGKELELQINIGNKI
jgi:hypothetical protein